MCLSSLLLFALVNSVNLLCTVCICGLSRIISVTLKLRLFILGYGICAEKMMTSWFSKYRRITLVRRRRSVAVCQRANDYGENGRERGGVEFRGCHLAADQEEA